MNSGPSSIIDQVTPLLFTYRSIYATTRLSPPMIEYVYASAFFLVVLFGFCSTSAPSATGLAGCGVGLAFNFFRLRELPYEPIVILPFRVFLSPFPMPAILCGNYSKRQVILQNPRRICGDRAIIQVIRRDYLANPK